MHTAPMPAVGRLVDPAGRLTPASTETVARRVARRLEEFGDVDRRLMLGQEVPGPQPQGRARRQRRAAQDRERQAERGSHFIDQPPL